MDLLVSYGVSAHITSEIARNQYMRGVESFISVRVLKSNAELNQGKRSTVRVLESNAQIN